jgi:TetR/AcrR family transcriptional regulator, transcriptional repressor for nem operon
MGRPKCFDESKVLDLAIDCFWKNGLKASSIRTLADEMGIAGPSLYNAYGNKQTLFTKALERYAETTMRPRFLRVRNLPPLDAVRAFLQEQVEIAASDPECKGCFFVNTAIETACYEQELSAGATAYLGEVKEFFSSNLRVAQLKGELSSEANIDEISELLYVIVVGICVRARTQPDRAELDAALAPALKLLSS